MSFVKQMKMQRSYSDCLNVMDKITLINMGTAQEADSQYKDFLAHAKQNNRHCKMWMAALGIVWAVSVIVVELLMQPGFARNSVQVIITCVVCIVLNGFYESLEPTTPYFYPPAYLYHELLKDYNILDVKLHYRYGKYDVELVIENKEHCVDSKFIYNFLSETRTDVSNYTVDMQKRMVYVPYEPIQAKISFSTP